MTQNVVAGTPHPLREGEVESIMAEVATAVELSLSGANLSRAAIGGGAPSPGTMLLLVTGLAGLSAVGSRRAARSAVADR